jgi:hypothetical protein
MVVDRIRALVKPALDEARVGRPAEPGGAFELLEQETAELAQEPSGVGLEVPAWLAALEQEVAEQSIASVRLGQLTNPAPAPDPLPLTLEEIHRQLTAWEQNPL